MEDLDTLQMELESLLNAVVVRSLNLQREIAGMTDKPSKSGQSFLKGVTFYSRAEWMKPPQLAHEICRHPGYSGPILMKLLGILPEMYTFR